MRLAPLFALLALAPALHAQAVPDTTAPWRYDPLAVGNRWEYRVVDNRGPAGGYYERWRRTIVKDTTVAGERWFVQRWQRFRRFSDWNHLSDYRQVVRFDTAAANVVVRTAGGGVSPVYPCRLDLPLTGEAGGECPGVYGYRKHVQPTAFGVETTVLYFQGLPRSTRLAAGLGMVYEFHELDTDIDVIYARVGGQTFGTPEPGMPNVPDPTPPEAYYPLGVGDEWQYEGCTDYPGTWGCTLAHSYVRYVVTRDTVVGGVPYVVRTSRAYALDGTPGGTADDLVRFDTPTGTVRRLYGGTEYVESCPLGADFASTTPCGPRFAGDVDVLPQNAAQPGDKVFMVGQESSESFRAGVGFTGSGSEHDSFTLRYARIDGVVFGSPVVAGEPGAPEASALALGVSPNPTVGPVALALTLPEPRTVTLEAFDALGRRVWRHEAALGAGAQSVAVDASAWAPGVYVVRATAGRASGTARVVRR